MADAGLLIADAGRDVLRAAGPESGSYLQGQLSQDVTGLADGGSAWSWLLAPNGKVDALVRVVRISAEEWLIDTDAGFGAPVADRLSRFKLRTKVEFEPAGLAVTALRGAGWEAALPADAVAVVTPPWPGVEGADVFTGSPGPPADPAAAARLELLRVRIGIPRMGAELDERTIPEETGILSMTVSFTKGCYTGQELVARIDSRGGNVPRRLRGLRFPAGATPVAGTALVAPDGSAAGAVTSVAADPDGGHVGLGYIRRAVAADVELTAVASEDEGTPSGAVGPVTQVELPR